MYRVWANMRLAAELDKVPVGEVPFAAEANVVLGAPLIISHHNRPRSREERAFSFSRVESSFSNFSTWLPRLSAKQSKGIVVGRVPKLAQVVARPFDRRSAAHAGLDESQ